MLYAQKRNGKYFCSPTSGCENLVILTTTLEGMRLRGGGPAYVKVGRLVRYSDELLEQWLLANQVGSTSQQINSSISCHICQYQ
jgi:hypothetical protein